MSVRPLIAFALLAPLAACSPAAPLAVTPASGQAEWAAQCRQDTWDAAAPPYRVHGNTFVVGTCGLNAVLVTGEEGHILIDGTVEAGAPLIAANIRKLGFRPEDVKILLHSHEHYDHVGGLAELQRLTGARVLASREARPVLESGVTDPNDPQAGTLPPFTPVKIDGTVDDRQTIRLGSIALTAHATPGHTAGALTWSWQSCEGDTCRTIVYADSLSPAAADSYRFSDHPEWVARYRASLAKLAALPCDILVSLHPLAADMPARLASAEGLYDPAACKAYARKKGQDLDARLASEAKR